MITQSIFGHTKAGDVVAAYRLTNGCGAVATVLDYGCILQALSVPNAQGGFTDVVLGYDTLAQYEEGDGYLGAAIGRVANRIGKGEFTLSGKTYKLARNNGENHLHGGIKGFDKFIWSAAVNGNALELSRVSPDGEEGYPGNLRVKVTYRLTEDNELRISYDAHADADTILNLTNHSYFNLNGGGTVLSHELSVFAERFTENDDACLPTGKLLDTRDTPFDFSQPKTLGLDIEADNEQLRFGHGYDHNFVLSDTAILKKAAVLYSPETGIVMTTLTTLPGIQVYSSNFLTQRKGKNGSDIDRRYALCLETQVFPNAMACPNFPSPILRVGEHFHTETVYRFETK